MMTRPRKFVLAMLAVWAVTGLIEPHTPHPGEPFNEIALVQIVVWAVLLREWVKAHASMNNLEPPTGAPLFAAVLPPLGVPYYAFRAFGFLRGLKLVSLALLAMILMFGVYLIMFKLSASMA
jgi:hypothetical protein